MTLHPLAAKISGARTVVLTTFYGARARHTGGRLPLGAVVWSGHPAEWPARVLPGMLLFVHSNLVKAIDSAPVKMTGLQGA